MTDASPTPELRRIAADLYGLRPEEFTAARTVAEKRARAEGQRELATQVKALRRPSVAAWAVNLLVRRRAELVEQVVQLGDSLRQAQSSLQGEALRELAGQRRRLVAAVTAEARSLAAEEGHRLSEAAGRQVEETVQAALADPAAAEAVHGGLLEQPLSSTGLESLTEVVAVPPDGGGAAEPGEPADPAGPADRAGSGEPAGSGKPARLTLVRDEGRARRAAEQRAERADRTVRRMTKAVDSVAKRRAKAQARALQVEAELDELRRRVAELEEQCERAAERLTGLDAEAEEAQDALDAARAYATEAARALREL